MSASIVVRRFGTLLSTYFYAGTRVVWVQYCSMCVTMCTCFHYLFVENVSVTAQPLDRLDRWLSYSESGLVNRSIRLTCAATGSPPVVTTWFHNGRTIQGNESIIIQSGSNATQVCGMYQCFVKNLHSEASQHFRVKLYCKWDLYSSQLYKCVTRGMIVCPIVCQM